MAIESPLQQLIVDFLKEKGVSQRKFGADMDVSESALSTYNRMSSAMGIDLLDKIMSTYPDIKHRIIAYLGGNTDKNITAAPFSEEAAVLRLEVEKYRKAADALARINLMNAQTIAELTSGEVVKQA
jgi:transcriptional regulator with XRE-family HTH domain